MESISDKQFIERLQFFNGQRLFAPDLQAIESFNREMRWLHNQSLHQPGVGRGFAVTGQKGDREVVIAPGYALDACGREIVLNQTLVEPIPPVADDGNGQPVVYDLTVAYPDDADLEVRETRDGICLPRGVVRLQEAPIFCWAKLDPQLQPTDPRIRTQIQTGMRILLGRIEVLNCQLNKPVSVVQRRNARPSQQPFVGCGMTDPNSTAWDLWTVGSPPNATVIGLMAVVSTASAGFNTPPRYTAQVAGERFFSSPAALEVNSDVFLLDGFVDVADAKADQFLLRMLMPQSLLINELITVNPTDFFNDITAPQRRALLAENKWQIVWMGVEG